MKKTFLGLLVFFGTVFLVSQSLAASETHWGSRGWLQFPSNDFSPIHDPGIDMTSSAQLALTAEGPDVAMTYTVATYELKPLPNHEMIELQIFDAQLNPGLGNDSGSAAVMELIFEQQGHDDWWVECWDEIDRHYVTVADLRAPRLAIGDPDIPCRFPKQGWSSSLRVFPGSNSSLNIKTVWLGSAAEYAYLNKPASYNNLLNVFRLQSRFGIIRLADTHPGIVSLNDGTPISFRDHEDKSIYEESLNWAVLYKTKMKTFFSFEIDVSDIQSNYLLLWDKDADANKLFKAKGKADALPPDDGIKMMVRWSDGSPLKYDKSQDSLNGGIPITNDPEWTHFDQTNREGFRPAWHIEGETNEYDGPSWDSGQDPRSHDSLRWYRIPLHERISDTILVGWYGSTMPRNTFAFAASGPVSPAPCSDPSFCRKVFELPQEDSLLVCPESGHKDCTNDSSSFLKISIDADPAPESGDLLKKNIESLRYYLTIENTENNTISDLSLVFFPPVGTRLDPQQELVFDQENRILLDPLIYETPQEIVLEVLLNDNVDEYDVISTQDRLFFERDEGFVMSPSIIRHYPGTKDGLEQGCVVEGIAKVCISSLPESDPEEESFGLDPKKADKNTIEYQIIVENISPKSEAIPLEKLRLQFENPLYTSLQESFIDQITTDNAETYTGKGIGFFTLEEALDPGELTEFSFTVLLDEIPNMTDYDISSAGKFQLLFDNHPKVQAAEQVHHVGRGGVNIIASRCYAFDYFGGAFECSDMCQNVEPGTRITVRDRLENIGGANAYNYQYFPLPLSESFIYEADSVRIDDPETGFGLRNDGASFPPEGGLQIPGPIASQQAREVFFSYFVPYGINDTEDDSGCFPEDDEVIETHPPDADTPELSYDQSCSLSPGEPTKKTGKICVSVEKDPRLIANLTSLPLEGTTLYQGSHVSYFLEISNQSSQAVAELIIPMSQAQQTQCLSGLCADLTVNEPLELSGKFSQMNQETTVKVNDDAQSNSIIHPGYSIRYRGADGDEIELQTNSVEHPLISRPEETGEFRHDIRLNRRTALNAAERNTPRSDRADTIEISHEFTYEGTKKSPVWPAMSGSRNYRLNVCNGQFPSYEDYDASFNASTILYNSENRQSELSTFEDLESADLEFQITSLSPKDRPELLVLSGINDHTHQFSFPFLGTRRDSRGLNGFMKQGGTIFSSELEKTVLRAVRDGVAGQISTTNQVLSNAGAAQIREDQWRYSRTGTRIDPVRCTRCTSKGCFRYPAVAPIYHWKISQDRLIPLISNDQDYATVLTSVAWLQTKNGHLGFGSPIWASDPGTGDPNWVNLGDKLLPSAMKWYTPPNQSNADLLVLHSGNQDPVESGLGSSGRVKRVDSQGFIDSPLEGIGPQISRGGAYDRAENPRDYLDDLLNRQLYGKVIRLNQAKQLPPGITRNGSEFLVEGNLFLEDDHVYHIKGELRIGKVGGSPVILSKGRARLLIDGSAQILSNVEYASSDANDLSQVTSIRLHTLRDIQVHPTVTDIELMMLAEGRFASGKSDKQLRILGDVIAQRAAWERRPLNNPREQDEEVNKPSEIIYEDFRKYLVAPPGDRKLQE